MIKLDKYNNKSDQINFYSSWSIFPSIKYKLVDFSQKNTQTNIS